jgi:hypothetical protein
MFSPSASRRSVRRQSFVALTAVVALLGTGASASAHSGRHPGGSPHAGSASDGRRAPGVSAGTAFYGAGDASGYHVYRADGATDTTWKELANLRPGNGDGDSWIGYLCVTGDGRFVVAVVAPRGAANRPALGNTAGTAYAVDTKTGESRPLAAGLAVKYHNPGCGRDGTVALTSYGGPEGNVTRLRVVDAASGEVTQSTLVRQHITSAIPAGRGAMAAAGRRVVEIGGKGIVRSVAAGGAPYQLRAGANGETAYLAHSGGDRTDVRVLRGEGSVRLGSARLRGARLIPTGAQPLLAANDVTTSKIARGHVGVLRTPSDLASVEAATSDGATVVAYPADGKVETRGHDHTSVAALPRVAPVLWSRRSRSTTETSLPKQSDVQPETALPVASRDVASSRSGPQRAAANTATPKCAVPRNALNRQVPQPSTEQVNWAIQQAVRGNLKGGVLTRPAGFLNMGLASYQPSSDFAPTALVGGGQIPPSVAQAIYAQETNWKQASFHALPGVSGNPLVSDYYGAGGGLDAFDYNKADCGYGISQVTDPMSASGTQYSANGKAKVAVDYAENIAAGLQILGDKWNQLKTAGVTVNGGNPAYLENWYFAIWAYNSGFHAQGAGARWGLGWTNNPQNADYDPGRSGFLRSTYADASHPADWPYQERVIGFMESPLLNYKGRASYAKPVHAGDATQRLTLPAHDLFCAPSQNECSPSYRDPANADLDFCARGDRECWWHSPVQFADCSANCTQSTFTYTAAATEPAGDDNYPPACSSTLPAGSIIVDDQPSNLNVEGCGSTNWSNSGTFSVTHGSIGGVNVGQIDWHQIGTGFGGHTYFTHNRGSGDAAHLETGTWTPAGLTSGSYNVSVHVPTSGASTEAVTYTIFRGDGTTATKTINQHLHANRWVLLGAYALQPGAKVVLTNTAPNTPGTTTVAYDAVGFSKLTSTPPTAPAAEIAANFRPSLFFDSSEKWRPLDVDQFLTEKRADGTPAHARCINEFAEGTAGELGHDPWDAYPDRYQLTVAESGYEKRAYCVPLHAVGDLTKWSSDGAFLHLGRTLSKSETDYKSPVAACQSGPRLECDGTESGLSGKAAIYSDVSDRSGVYYAQYWMFYRYNSFSDATDVGNHQGDWESYAVAPTSDGSSFHYASFSGHGHWYSYLRSTLRCTDQPGQGCGTDSAKAGRRVKVFVANGSHANYAISCSETVVGSCGQAGPQAPPERGYDGAREWGGNASPGLVKPLTAVGAGGWNNWSGHWGATGANGKPFGSGSPRSPANQESLYSKPWDSCAQGQPSCTKPASFAKASARFAPGARARPNDFASCDGWFGTGVNALLCDPKGLRQRVLGGNLKEAAGLRLRVIRAPRAVSRSGAAATPDMSGAARVLAQSVGTPLAAGDRIRIQGSVPRSAVVRFRYRDGQGRTRTGAWRSARNVKRATLVVRPGGRVLATVTQ